MVQSAPVYINKLLYHYILSRLLRSGDSNLLVILKTSLRRYVMATDHFLRLHQSYGMNSTTGYKTKNLS